MIRITKQEFDTFKRRKDPEVFTEAQINSWVLAHQETIQKSEVDELNDIEKAEVQAFNDEFSSFMKVEVVGLSDDLLRKGLKYETFYVREQQVEWNNEIIKSEDGKDETIVKGVYKDTHQNRKAGRVGSQYGGKKAEEDEDQKMIKRENENSKNSGDTIHHKDGTKTIVHSHKEMMDVLNKEDEPEEKKEDQSIINLNKKLKHLNEQLKDAQENKEPEDDIKHQIRMTEYKLSEIEKREETLRRKGMN